MQVKICEYCNSEFIAKTSAHKCCSKKCTDKLYAKMVRLNLSGTNNTQITCLRCNNVFYVSKSRMTQANKNNHDIKYCSRKCANIRGEEHIVGYSKFNIEKTCKSCGKTFSVRQYDLDKGNGIYCSRECSGADKRNNTEIICEVCGTIIKSYPCRVGIRRFCSRKCQSVSRAKPKSNISTVERKRGESKEWTQRIYKRDNWTCKICGKRGGDLNAHHIIPFSIDETLRYELSNGITLCEPCHKSEHNRLKNLSIEQLDIFLPKKRNYTKKETI